MDFFSIKRCILLHATLASEIQRSESAINIVTAILMFDNVEISVKALNDVSEFSVRRSDMTEINPAKAELVKNRAYIPDTRNPRMRIREISFLRTKRKIVKVKS